MSDEGVAARWPDTRDDGPESGARVSEREIAEIAPAEGAAAARGAETRVEEPEGLQMSRFMGFAA